MFNRGISLLGPLDVEGYMYVKHLKNLFDKEYPDLSSYFEQGRWPLNPEFAPPASVLLARLYTPGAKAAMTAEK